MSDADPVINSYQYPFASRRVPKSKRIFDIASSSIGLACVSPLFLAIALFVRLDSPGPIFYRQIRLGKESPFELSNSVPW